ncbi:hypothetical protein [Flavobacterium sp. WC2430]|uniref:hypothetical protein n=1 Tax=Flavobacterium sp. WC2430 TaxID=3234137 RepID=UPI003465C78B
MSINKINVWEEFAKISCGKFIEGVSWYSDRTEIDYKNTKVVFDNYTLWSGKFSTEKTRVIVSFISVDNFKFEIYRNGFVRKIEKLFGAQDIEIGRADFDKDFIIKANNEFKTKKLLQNQKIRNYLENLKEVNIQISDQNGIWEDKLPKGELQLSFFSDEEIKDFQVLNLLLDLFKEMLDELFEMNSINYKQDFS